MDSYSHFYKLSQQPSEKCSPLWESTGICFSGGEKRHVDGNVSGFIQTRVTQLQTYIKPTKMK